ncbi:hypothetical protein [Ruminococcus sp. OA3]|nr:hypothetical protein [Ruminococcus sp. OA3]
MTRVRFYDHAEEELLRFAVIIAKTEGRWFFYLENNTEVQGPI